MAIDYEVEYNNRARVPEHPQIFARWAARRRRLPRRSHEGRPRRARPEVRPAPAPDHRPVHAARRRRRGPLALFIHGGYWRSLEPSTFSQMARGMNAHGVTVAVSGYDLCPQVSIGDIVEQIAGGLPVPLEALRPAHHGQRPFGRRASRRLHGRDRLAGARCRAPADLVPAAMRFPGCSISAPLLHLAINADFKLDDAEARRISPLFWPVPTGRVFDAVVGGAESANSCARAGSSPTAGARSGVETRYEAISGREPFHRLRSD